MSIFSRIREGLSRTTKQIVERFDEIDPRASAAFLPAVVGWLDWLLAGLVFLGYLGVRSMRLLSNNPRKLVGIEGYGLSISEWIPLEIPASDTTRTYLKTKKEKLGHKLSSV